MPFLSSIYARAAWLLMTALLGAGCDSSPEKPQAETPTAIAPAEAPVIKLVQPPSGPINTVREITPPPNWTDTLLIDFVKHSENPLVKGNREAGLSIEWLYDQLLRTDTATYFVFHIGHDMTDEGGENPRFATDAWVNIDTLTHKVYEHDIAADSLVEWPPK